MYPVIVSEGFVISIVVRVIDSFSIQMNLELVNKQKKKGHLALTLFWLAEAAR